MDTKEVTSAANALVGWFNSQDIAPRDAQVVMSKVLAKLIVTYSGVTEKGSLPNSKLLLDIELDSHTLQLVHDINDRLFHVLGHK